MIADQRRAQVVADRGEERRAQPFGLGEDPGLLEVGDEAGALERDGDLVDQEVEQPALRRGERARVVPGDAEHAEPSLPGADRQEQPARGGQRGGAAAGRLAALPGPVRGGPVAHVEPVLGREGADDREAPAFVGREQERVALQRRAHVGDGGPDHVVEGGGARHLPAEVVERVGLLGAGAQRLRALAELAGEVSGQHRGDVEEHERQHVLLMRHVEGQPRIGEEEVVAEEAQRRGVERRPEAVAGGDEDDAGEKDQRQRGHRQQTVDRPGGTGRERHDRRSPRRRPSGRARR